MGSDRTAIEHLLAEYADRIDDGDFAGIGELFGNGRICDVSGAVLAEGADEAHRLYESTTMRHSDGTPRTHHAVTNVVVDVDGDQARARSRFVVFQTVADGSLQPVITGRYEDSFARRDGVWHFSERRMDPRLTGDLSEHLRIDVPEPGRP